MWSVVHELKANPACALHSCHHPCSLPHPAGQLLATISGAGARLTFLTDTAVREEALSANRKPLYLPVMPCRLRWVCGELQARSLPAEGGMLPVGTVSSGEPQARGRIRARVDPTCLCSLAVPLAREAEFNHMQRSVAALCFGGEPRRAALVPPRFRGVS